MSKAAPHAFSIPTHKLFRAPQPILQVTQVPTITTTSILPKSCGISVQRHNAVAAENLWQC